MSFVPGKYSVVMSREALRVDLSALRFYDILALRGQEAQVAPRP
jgi:hypothetical protein